MTQRLTPRHNAMFMFAQFKSEVPNYQAMEQHWTVDSLVTPAVQEYASTD